jgi:phosphate transport system substrate-binding protein
LSLIGIAAYRAYDSSIDIVSTSISHSIATLDEPATLQMDTELRMDGATALLPMYLAFAQATYSKESMINNSTAPEAFKRLVNGDVDMIFIAEPSSEQLLWALDQGMQLELHPIGREAFVFFVNADNPIDGLSTEQIRDIYSGKITNWRELGGRNKDIKAYQRYVESASQKAFLRIMAEAEPMAPILGEEAGVAADYKNYAGALGYAFRYFVELMPDGSQLKLLELDGVYPSVENIRNGSYSQSGYIYAVVDKNSRNRNIRPLLKWISAEQGQELVEKTGYVSLR